MQLSIRPFNTSDFDGMINYFLESSTAFLAGMGADKSKLPNSSVWKDRLLEDFRKPLTERSFFYVLWMLDGKGVGHSNLNKIQFGKEAFMHLHLWEPSKRQQGIGLQFLSQTLPLYFSSFELPLLYCEPYAENPAPNRILTKLGFQLEKTYRTTPGTINFEQEVNRYCLKKAHLG